MFRHVVLFKWKPDTSPDTVKEIVAGLTACGTALPGTRAYTCGPDVAIGSGLGGAEDRFDFAVVADFDDEDAWRAYDEDAEHNRLRAELIRPLIADRVIAQYEVAGARY